MKVKELILKLQALDPNRVVVLSGDSEGNSYRKLSSLWECAYSAPHCEVGIEKLTEKEIKQGYGEEDVMDGGVPAVVFYP